MGNQQKQQTNMNKYISSGFRSVVSESMKEAAEIFANRAARRKYGRSAYCRTCNMNSWSQDGSLGEFSAIIGYTTGPNETSGNNINFTVQTA